ncbi:MAG TPA: hypothetical protein VFJ71_00605 [Candidatus Limnocylindrales bacterium]|nr:hypothetical protein [Candidatus Limnocylindrales bacterium]
MSTDRETTRIVRSWLDEGVTKLPDRVLDAVLDQVPATPQRRSGWSAWRSYRMNTYAKIVAAAAAVLVVGVAAYQFLPRSGGVGGPGPTTTPSPSPSVLARGTFIVHGISTTLDATGTGSTVSGSMRGTSTNEGDFTVELHCERTIDGLRWIGGDVTASTYVQNAPVGTRTAIVLKPGSPVEAIFVFQMSDPRSASCQAFFDDMLRQLGPPDDGLAPIVGNVQLAP